MERRTLVVVVVILLGVALTGKVRFPVADAQDSSEGRVAVLAAAVAEHDREIDELRGRIATLEAEAPTAAPSPGASEGATSQATEEATDAAPTATFFQGTRDNPIPVGSTADIGNWTVTVIDAVRNATSRVEWEGSFVGPPPPGSQYFLISLRATYNGTEPDKFSQSVDWSAVGQSAVSYDEYGHDCGTIADGVTAVPEVFTGGTIKGDICFTVRAEDADSLVLYLSSSVSDDPVFFALRRYN